MKPRPTLAGQVAEARRIHAELGAVIDALDTILTTQGARLPGLEPAQIPSPQAVIAIWNEIVTAPIPRVLKRLSHDREARIRARLNEHPDLSTWRKVITWVNGQAWCRAQSRGEHAGWTATLDWLVRSEGDFQKQLERATANGAHLEQYDDGARWQMIRSKLADATSAEAYMRWFSAVKCLSIAPAEAGRKPYISLWCPTMAHRDELAGTGELVLGRAVQAVCPGHEVRFTWG